MRKARTLVIICILLFITVFGYSSTSDLNAQPYKQLLFLGNIPPSSNVPALESYPIEAEGNLQVNATSPMQMFNDAGLGLKFEIPSKWGEPLRLEGVCDRNDCTQLGYTLWGTKYAGMDIALAINIFIYDKESFGLQGACHCNTLKDFMGWNYNPTPFETFIEDNQTTIGDNQPAWQTTSAYVKENRKATWVSVFTINDGTVYEFKYGSEKFDINSSFAEFKNVLDSVQFMPREEPKKPSFLA